MAESMRPVDPTDVAEIEVLGRPEPGEADFEVSLESLDQWQLAWRRFRRHKMAVLGSAVLGVVIAIAIIAPILWPYDITQIPGAKTYGGDPPSVNPMSALFGTDFGGRSVLQQVLVGARISVAVGIFTMVIATFIGVVVGAIAGYFGGRTDGILMRMVDLLLAIPFLFVILVAARFFGGGGDPISLILIFGLLSWAGMARLTRAMFLSLREMEFVLAARAAGIGDMRIAFRHILPNTLGPIVVSATLIMASAIVLEAFVSYLNFGIRATDVSWGNALSNSKGFLLSGNWWWPFFPGMAIAITVIAVNFMGDGLRDALDPRAKDLG